MQPQLTARSSIELFGPFPAGARAVHSRHQSFKRLLGGLVDVYMEPYAEIFGRPGEAPAGVPAVDSASAGCTRERR